MPRRQATAARRLVVVSWFVLGALAACEKLDRDERVDPLTGGQTTSADTTVGLDTDATDATDAPDAAPDVDEATVLRPRFDLDGSHFFDRPWPADSRRTRDGRLDMRGFPNAGQNPVLDLYLSEIEKLRGFSVAPVVYLRFDGPLAEVTLPAPTETLTDDAPVQLVGLGERCGERLPVIVNQHQTGDRFLQKNTLVARPVPGFWLPPESTWALVVRDDLGAADGLSIERPADFDAMLASHPSYDPLEACAETGAIELDRLAVATVFTVQDPLGELRALRDEVADPQRLPSPRIAGWHHRADLDVEDRFTTYFAEYRTPIFQAGESPYDEDGAFVFDAAGRPVVQRWETVPMTVLVPAEPALDPAPVLVWIDGTGANRVRPLSREVVRKALDAGFVVAWFVPQMHPGRGPASADPILHGFNYLNPTSGRSVFRQQAIDTTFFVRLIRESLAVDGLAGVPALRTDRLVYGGHSQGALVGGLLAGVESDFASYVLNGVGGWLSVTVEERTDPLDVAATVAAFFGLDERNVHVEHPLVNLAQTGADVVDPHAYVADWRGHAAKPDGASVLMINGLLDHTTFPRSMNALTIRGDFDLLAPAGWDVDPWDVWPDHEVAAPVQGNRTSYGGDPLTMIEILDADHGHYTLHEIPALQDKAVTFWLTSLEGAARLD